MIRADAGSLMIPSPSQARRRERIGLIRAATVVTVTARLSRLDFEANFNFKFLFWQVLLVTDTVGASDISDT
jgi:hypothetical protein